MRTEPQQMSGRVLSIAAVSIAALLIAIGYRLGATAPADPVRAQATAPEQTGTAHTPAFESDTDGDGMPDWQERLLGSDANDPDSTATSTNPVFQYVSNSQATGTPVRTPTDSLTQRLVTEYLEVKETDAFTPEEGAAIGEDLASGINAGTRYEPYERAALQISSDTSSEAAMQYRESMQEVLEPLTKLEEPEFVIYGRAIEENSPEPLDELRRVALIYEDVAAEAVRIPVPADAAEYHLNAVNALGYFATVLKDMARYINDPIASFALLRTYNDAETYMVNTFDTLSTYYITKQNEQDADGDSQ